ncbi:DUF2470 domain-containing protein [Motilibacter deserti]|uniref:DUF2470 domain-containing protein n=1 Tax=Motilibacter deserti TaxID=2714956 RepID=A0ABX0GUS4_9ACTN|nr:DUF2470 domain-containing protein [Motilibacter deserti]NHC14305.1 DUF2470 domain-containing protein [Motilibacter deserti]
MKELLVPISAAAAGSPTGRPRLSAPERVRSVVQAAGSVTLVTGTHRAHLEGLHAVAPDGGLLLALPEDSTIAAEAAQEGGLPAHVELTDVAPVAVKDRVRARVLLAGWLETEDVLDDAPQWRLTPVEVTLEEEGRRVELDGEDYAAASPDPLCCLEAELVSHLDSAHGAELDALLHACPPALDGGRRTRPLRLDRHGLTLRVERLAGSCDVRVPFPRPVRDVEEAGAALRALTAAALAARLDRPDA